MTTHILTHFHKRRTGVTTHVEDLVRALNASGRKAVVLGESISSNTPQVSRGDVEALLQTGRPVTWHAQRTHSLREGLRLRQQWPHLRVLWTHHNWKPPGWLTTRLLKQADGVVCLTQEGADQLRTNAAVIAAVIGHGVPLDLIQPAPLPLEPRLGVIGRIRPDKGHRSVVEAFARVKPTSPSWTIRFFGETRPQHRRFQKTLQRQLPDSLEICGYATERSAIYASLTAVVMPSPAEGFSLVVPEALAAGLPLIATRLPHFERCLRDGSDVLFFDPHTPGDLVRVLRLMMRDTQLQHAMRTSARKAAEKHFSVLEEAEAVAAFYDKVLSSPRSL